MLEPASAVDLDESRPPDGDPTPGEALHFEQEAPAPPTVVPAARLGAALEVLLCSGFPTQILLIGILTGAGLPIQAQPGRLSSSFVFVLSLLDTLLVVSLVLFFIRAHRESAREMFLDRRPIGRETLLGVFLVPVLFALVLVVFALVQMFAPQLHNVERNPFEDLMTTRRDTLSFGVVVMIAGGVREEIQRAFILRRFERYLGGRVTGVVVFSTLFGLGHLEQGIDAAIATGLLGASWGVLYLARGSIVAPMVSHGAFNLAQLVKHVALARF